MIIMDFNIYELFNPVLEGFQTEKKFEKTLDSLYEVEFYGLDDFLMARNDSPPDQSRANVNIFTYKKENISNSLNPSELINTLLTENIFKQNNSFLSMNSYSQFKEELARLDKLESKLDKSFFGDGLPFVGSSYSDLCAVFDLSSLISVGASFKHPSYSPIFIFLMASFQIAKYISIRNQRKESKKEIYSIESNIAPYRRIIGALRSNLPRVIIPDKTQLISASLDYLKGNSLINLNVEEVNNRLMETYINEYKLMSN